MSFGFPPRCESAVNLNLGVEDMNALVRETLSDLDWPYTYEHGEFSGRTRTSDSFAKGGVEFIRITVEEFIGITVKSQCLSPLPFFDLGKNRDNVETFIELLSLKSLDRSPRFSSEQPHGGKDRESITE
jgi:hypothetical protein